MRQRQHRRGQDKPPPGILSGDLFGPLVVSLLLNRWSLATMESKMEMSFMSFMPNKSSAELEEAVTNLQIDMRSIWRWHGDQEKGYKGMFKEFLRKLAIRATNTGGLRVGGEQSG